MPLISFLNRRFFPLEIHHSAPRHFSTLVSNDVDADIPELISKLVLNHPSTAVSALDSLASTISSSFPYPSLSPAVVDAVLKRLWNDGPRALLFFRALLRLPSLSPSPTSFDHAIDIAARLRDRSSLRFLLSARLSAGLPFSHRTFAILAERFVAVGKPDRAIRLFLSLHHHGIRQELRTFNTLLDVLCKSRRVCRATSLFKTFKPRFGADTITFNILADGWCGLKRTGKALDVLKEMMDSGLNPTLTTYNILLKGFFRSGQVKEALEFFRQMKKRGRKKGSDCFPDVVSYTTVVHGLGVAGQIKDAYEMFDEMISQGCMPSVATYNAFIQVLCIKDDIQNALSIFYKMLSKGCTPNVTTYNMVIRGLCHGTKMEQAMKFMENMMEQHNGCKPNVHTYNIVLRHWCEMREIDKALDLVGRMNKGGDCLPNLDTYNLMISGMIARRRSEDNLVAGKMVMEMVQRGYLPRRFMFNKVLNGLLLTGNQHFAREILRMQERFGRLRREIRL